MIVWLKEIWFTDSKHEINQKTLYEVYRAVMNISMDVLIYKIEKYLLKFGRICSIVLFDVFVKMKATCFGHRLSCKVHQGENDKNRKELHITWVLIFVVLLFTPMYSWKNDHFSCLFAVFFSCDLSLCSEYSLKCLECHPQREENTEWSNL